jgi:phosphatidylserine/phosphatidylglycerophosphate/cardiolipin synthase-like enzyme
MKKLFFILFFSAFLVGSPRQQSLKNMQLCLNNTDNFGKTHFIVGYKEKKPTVVLPKKRDSEKKRKQVRKKNDVPVRCGAELIDKNRHTQSFFTSIHDLSDIILALLVQAEKSISIAAFTLTDARIADLIIEKHKNGVKILIITDASNTKQTYSKVHKLIDNNIPVLSYRPSLNPYYKSRGLSEPFMHHKCICIDDKMVITGSANLTKAGQRDNMENINILRDPQAVSEHCEEIKRLKEFSVQCKS